jgi:hypothetical protein
VGFVPGFIVEVVVDGTTESVCELRVSRAELGRVLVVAIAEFLERGTLRSCVGLQKQMRLLQTFTKLRCGTFRLSPVCVSSHVTVHPEPDASTHVCVTVCPAVPVCPRVSRVLFVPAPVTFCTFTGEQPVCVPAPPGVFLPENSSRFSSFQGLVS